MNTPDSTIIVKRFFHALDTLKAEKRLHGISNFTDKYNIDRRNLDKLRADPSRSLFQVAWLHYLHIDYNISLDYLLSGEGELFL